MDDVSASEIDWRLGSEAASILAGEAHESNLAALGNRLRKSFTPERAAWLTQQIELRRRAKAKFSAAQSMYFTTRGLEQATDEVTAAYKAARFPLAAPLADLCCGIGGDLQAMSQRATSARAVDLDPWLAAVSQANSQAAGVPVRRVESRVEAACVAHVADAAAWHVDPDRRVAQRRLTQPDDFSPSWTEVASFVEANPNAAVKLAPASGLPPDWAERGEREWISYRGECRQQTLWLGALTNAAGSRRATALQPGREPASLSGSPDEGVAVAENIGRYLIDPDASVLAARLAGAACRVWDAAACDRDAMYLTSENFRDDPLGDWFEVQDVLPLDVKKLKAYFRERNVGRLELKTRGADVKLDDLSKRLGLPGGGELLTMIAARTSHGVKAAIARRVRRGDPSQPNH
ncbi:MAG TPA: class I SAM-dependent methyltransferase [Pirellulales bacterium]